MNPWLEPFRRSYQSIKDRLIGQVKEIKDDKGLPLITDTSEGNILVLLVSLFSSIAEVINVYIDNVYRESFLSTSQRLDSVHNHMELIDYHGHMATTSVVEVTFTRPINSNDISSSYTRAKDSLSATDVSGNIWYLDEELYIAPYVSSVKARFKQHSNYTLNSSTLEKDSKDRMFALIPSPPSGQYIEDGSIGTITIDTGSGSETYTVVETLAYSGPEDRHCVIYSVNETAISILFGDNLFGKKPSESYIGRPVRFSSCKITAGSKGNIPSNSLTLLNESVLSSFTINNVYPSSGGTDYEDLNSIQYRAPLSVKTLGVAVTKEDILDIVRLQPGVARAEMEYVCGQYIRIYISGLGNTAMNTALCNQVKEELLKHLPINTTVEVVPLQTRNIFFRANVVGKPTYTEDILRNQIINALYITYNLASVSTADNSVKNVRISDMYALIDNLPSVDYLNIEELYITPWLEPLNTSAIGYVKDFTLKKARGTRTYVLSFTSQTNFTIYPYENTLELNGNNATPKQWTGSTSNKLPIEDGDFQFDIQFESGSAGAMYKFQVIEGNKDIDTQGFFNIAIDPSKINLSIQETV